MRGLVRRRHRGQALVELAIALPVLVVLLAGGAQFGAIVWGNVSTDSAAHEAAVSGAAAPYNSLTKAVSEGAAPGLDGHGAYTYQCKAYQSGYSTVESDPICITAYDAAGAVVQSSMTVQIYAPPLSAGGGVSMALPSGDVIRVDNPNGGNTCSSNYEQVSGTVPTLPNNGEASVTSWNGAQTTTSSLSYVLCVKPSQNTVEPLGASYTDPSTGCSYAASLSNFIPTNNGTLTWSPTQWNVTCPTTSSSSSSSSTSSSSSSSTSRSSSSSTSVSTSSVAAPTCTSNSPAPYFSVTVSYKVPIFVPFVGGLLSDGSGSVRTVKETVWMEADPCGVTQGN